jgi:hypothetical protein
MSNNTHNPGKYLNLAMMLCEFCINEDHKRCSAVNACSRDNLCHCHCMTEDD